MALVDEPPAPDAGASMLGHYGLVNPMMAWLLRRHPELLAETPTEFRGATEPAPRCGAGDGLERCRQTMLFRYDERGQAVWKCYEHEPPLLRPVRRPEAAMQRGLRLELDWMLKATREGKILDLVFDDGGWLPQARTPGEGNHG